MGYRPMYSFCFFLFFDPEGVRNVKYYGEYGYLFVCLSLCLSVRSHNSKTARPNFNKFLVHVARGRDSVLLRRRCGTLCTSGFTDDVMTSCFRTTVPMGRIKHDVVRKSSLKTVPVGRLVEFVGTRHPGRYLLSMIALSLF